MQEQSRYVVGIDVGTKNVRCVVGYVNGVDQPKLVGIGTAPNAGMRKGIITNLNGPAIAIDKALEGAEQMSGHQVASAVMSVNGSHLLSTKTDGMITVGATNNEVTVDDIVRLEDVASTGKVPQNRSILEIVAHSYRLDGQDNIKDPIGMTGARLEMRASVVSSLAPHITNLKKVADMAKIEMSTAVPTVLASSQAVLSESQRENGVAVIDLGGATTGVAVFEEGDLQYLSVIPVGMQSVTNDLAIGLRTDPEVAEAVKLAHAQFDGKARGVVETKYNKKSYTFDQEVIDEIISARYEEIFEAIAKEIKKAGRSGKLPSGVVLVGGGANVRGVVEFAKDRLGVAAQLGIPHGFIGAGDEAAKPEYAAAVGLMLIDAMNESYATRDLPRKTKEVTQKASGFIRGLLARFK